MSERLLHVTDTLPEYRTKGGTLIGEYDCNNGGYAVSIINTNRIEYADYVSSLTSAGAVLYTENTIAGNRFATYRMQNADGTHFTVRTVFYPAICNVRVIVTPHGYLPPTDPSVLSISNGVRTSVTQPVRDGIYNGNNGETVNGAPGMGYIVTLADGSFVLIDGGPRCTRVMTKHPEGDAWVNDEPRDADDVKRFYDYLVAHTPEGKKPTIVAWLFTHAHSDHVNLAIDFLARYKDDVRVIVGGYNFPDFLKNPTKNENNEVLQNLANTTAERLRDAGAIPWVFHTGEKMYLPGCELEILYTHEDYFPRAFAWGNHTSSAFRMKFAGKTVLFLGDCEKDICQSMTDKYGAELKSDVLQVSHHGVNGACASIYHAIDPEICLWPIDDFRFTTDGRCTGALSTGYEFNAWLRDETVRVRKHYHNSEEVTVYTDEP